MQPKIPHYDQFYKNMLYYQSGMPVQLKKRKEVHEAMATDLVRPGDIHDVADSEDLLRALEIVNLPKVDNQIDTRARTELRKKREKEIMEEYDGKAKQYYEKLWERCDKSTVGHSFANLDIGHSTIRVCDTCSYAKGRMKKNGDKLKEQDNGEGEYKQTIIRQLAKQMIELDKTAGILEWPTDDDFIGLEKTLGQKKRKLFR
jgi:hypothetical protein